MAVELFTALIKARYGNVYEFKKYR
ncbi:MAG: hypothetical protein JWN76_1251, partial [Chitinophagaceae bacterium]|nr:hypothetical protein [Chitinophagaceae bacterium]